MQLIHSDFITICQFSAGRRIVVYEQMQPVAVRRSDTLVGGHIARGLAHDWRTHELDMRWHGRPTHSALYGGELKESKHQVDRLLTGIRDVALVHMTGLYATDPRWLLLEQFLADVFPAGVGALTKIAYVDQSAAAQIVLSKLQGPYAVLMAELGLSSKVEQLADASQKLRIGLRDREAKMDFKEVRAARRRGHAILLEIVAIILGRYYDLESAEHEAARTEFLTPVMKQNEMVRARRKASRAGTAAGEEDVPLPGAGEDSLDEGGDRDKIPAPAGGSSVKPAAAGVPAVPFKR